MRKAHSPTWTKFNKGNVNARLKEIKGDPEAKEEAQVLKSWLKLNDAESDLKKRINDAEAKLDKAAYEKYPSLTVDRDQGARDR